MNINFANGTIEMSQKDANEARIYGSEAYIQLMNIRKDFPQFQVVVKKAKRKVDRFKGLDFNFMENYIKTHATDDEMLVTFYTLCGKNEDGNSKTFGAYASYGEIKSWFLERFPELNIQRKRIDEILGKKPA